MEIFKADSNSLNPKVKLIRLEYSSKVCAKNKETTAKCWQAALAKSWEMEVTMAFIDYGWQAEYSINSVSSK